MPAPNEKIKVFISSACGNSPDLLKYNIVRAGIKTLLEATYLFDVYVFEDKGASTLSAGQHYTYALEDCDVCVFLIDNKDKIPNGVQVEIDTVNKCSIRALYYFCDKESKEETPLQKSITGAMFAKSKVVHSFEEFLENGASDLINDILIVYKYYCKGRIADNSYNIETTIIQPQINDVFYASDSFISKTLLINVDKCKNYFSLLAIGVPTEIKNTCSFDDLASSFLPILFDGKHIKDYNVALLLNEIEISLSPEHYAVIAKRWDAVNEYFLGNLSTCIEKLQLALALARDTMPEWVVKDILIDLRNLNWSYNEGKNQFILEDEYQKEINNSESMLHYPLLDRFCNDYYEKMEENKAKEIAKSLHTVEIGHDIFSYTNILASIFITCIYNGSITQLHHLYTRLNYLMLSCCEKYADWNLKTLLLKTLIINHNTKTIKGTIRYYDDILCKMNATDAIQIYQFADNHPIPHRRFFAKLEAFRSVGYFLSDNDFSNTWSELFQSINEWLDDDEACVTAGNHIFNLIEDVFLRINKEEIALICCKSIESKKRRFFDDLFRIIYKCVEINDISKEPAERLISGIIRIIQNADERNQISNFTSALVSLRKQNRELTDELDKNIAQHMEKFYNGTYKLETTTTKDIDMPIFVLQFIETIRKHNESQGKHGVYSFNATQPYTTLLAILSDNEVHLPNEMLDLIFVAASNTLLERRQIIGEKMSATELLIYLCRKFPDVIGRSMETIDNLRENKNIIESAVEEMSNLSDLNLQFSLLLFYTSLGDNCLIEIIEKLAEIGDIVLSHIHSGKVILTFLEANGTEPLAPQLESILLQQAIYWCKSKNIDVRWYALRILFSLLRNPDNHKMICTQLVKQIDNDHVYIINSILRCIQRIKDIDPATYDYILQKASLNTNYVVRKVYSEICDC